MHASNELIIDAYALQQNYLKLCSYGFVIPVIKSDAYGIGMLEVAQILAPLKPPYFCVAFVHEAIALRKQGILTPLLVLYSTPDDVNDALTYHLTLSVDDLNLCILLNELGKQRQQNVEVHLNLETGLHRTGFKSSEFTQILKIIQNLPYLEITGVMSHFIKNNQSTWDEICLQQKTLFNKAIDGFNCRYIHLCSSSSLKHHTAPYNTIRIGAGLYGFELGLEPVVRLQSKVIRTHFCPQKGSIGYRQAYINQGTDHKTGIIPLGYAHGLRTSLEMKGSFWIQGKQARILAIFMDCCVVDLRKINATNDEVAIFFGKRDTTVYSLEKVAQEGSTPFRELLSQMGKACKKKVLHGQSRLHTIQHAPTAI